MNNELIVKRATNCIDKHLNEDTAITIALDFEGTCVEYGYPKIGKNIPRCVEILREWQKSYNVRYILDSMRSSDKMNDAIEWFNRNEIKLFSIGKDPSQDIWTDSNKCHAMFSIDDRNVPQFLMLDSNDIPCIDWNRLYDYLDPILEQIFIYIKQNLNSK